VRHGANVGGQHLLLNGIGDNVVMTKQRERLLEHGVGQLFSLRRLVSSVVYYRSVNHSYYPVIGSGIKLTLAVAGL